MQVSIGASEAFFIQQCIPKSTSLPSVRLINLVEDAYAKEFSILATSFHLGLVTMLHTVAIHHVQAMLLEVRKVLSGSYFWKLKKVRVIDLESHFCSLSSMGIVLVKCLSDLEYLEFSDVRIVGADDPRTYEPFGDISVLMKLKTLLVHCNLLVQDNLDQ